MTNFKWKTKGLEILHSTPVPPWCKIKKSFMKKSSKIQDPFAVIKKYSIYIGLHQKNDVYP